MIDLPAGWAETLQNIDWDAVREKVQDYGPALKVVQGTWSRESLLDIAQGKLFVPDSVMNDAIAKSLTPEGKLTALTLTSQENGRLAIAAEAKDFGKIELTGEVKEFVHEGDKSYIVYRVRERNLPGKGLASWIFSRISMSMASRLVGHLDLPENMPMEIHGNTIRVDYSKALAESDVGKTEFEGHRLMDMITVTGAKPKAGGIEFQTELNVPDDVKQALLRIALGKGEEKPEGTETSPQTDTPSGEKKSPAETGQTADSGTEATEAAQE